MPGMLVACASSLSTAPIIMQCEYLLVPVGCGGAECEWERRGWSVYISTASDGEEWKEINPNPISERPFMLSHLFSLSLCYLIFDIALSWPGLVPEA